MFPSGSFVILVWPLKLVHARLSSSHCHCPRRANCSSEGGSGDGQFHFISLGRASSVIKRNWKKRNLGPPEAVFSMMFWFYSPPPS